LNAKKEISFAFNASWREDFWNLWNL